MSRAGSTDCRGRRGSMRVGARWRTRRTAPATCILPGRRILCCQSRRVSTMSKTDVQVGSYAANRLGLFDMHGDAFEWCDALSVAPPDPLAVMPKTQTICEVRGGSWHHGLNFSRAAVPYVRPAN